MQKLLVAASFMLVVSGVFASGTPKEKKAHKPKADPVNAGLKLKPGFSAVAFAENVGRTRHIFVTPKGDVYAKLERPKDGKAIILLKDKNGDNKADETSGFANYGGTGITIKDGYLYASSNSDVYRYKLNSNYEVIDTNKGERIITGLVNGEQHNTKSIVLDNSGNIYVNIGAPANSCQEEDRATNSKGKDPCPLLETAGGIWQFKADKIDQTYSNGVHYASGIRNVVGLDWNTEVNDLFVMQHGRDQLDMFPAHFTAHQSVELPAEIMIRVKKGGNYGWPYCYYDPFQKKTVLAPEYGGDGKTVGRCALMDQPVAAFPAHMAPNGLLFYTGNLFPEKYKNGAFIAFHGSWNRAPEKQEGYYVVFMPFKNGRPAGDWEVFADGFAGVETVNAPRQAQHRPCGLAQGPDGSLYVSDDVKGTIYKISYKK
ncbi:MAG: sorbosone dehydrogenase [Chitinophagaceae bacterium]|nr:sorbosone dehydrogenase [Chitinophagaceae bacterium]